MRGAMRSSASPPNRWDLEKESQFGRVESIRVTGGNDVA